MGAWFSDIWERIKEVADEPWGTVGLPTLLTVGGLQVLICFIQLASRDGWVPLLDSVNLVFHEAGHPLFSPFGETLHILGGTLMQLLVPLLVCGSGWWKRQLPVVGFGAFWGFQNLHNIARYLGDARAQVLPLVGGGEHDWTNLLGQWGLLHRDQSLAGMLHGFGWLGMVAAMAWLAWRGWEAVRHGAPRE